MMAPKANAIVLLSVCEIAALALWFSATAVLPSIVKDAALSPAQVSLFTSAVQAGFVCGTLVSAMFGLADRLDPRRFFMGSALIAAAANATLLWLEPGTWPVYAMRFVTGLCMAGIYPVGMKIAASWAKGDLGLLVAILVGALTLGSASPHLFNAFGGLDWRFTIAATSISALGSGLAVNLVALGPNRSKATRFSPAQFTLAFRRPALRLANLGYFGHMWELYAMWAWLAVFLAESFTLNPGGEDTAFLSRVTTFAVIGVGGLAGCLAGGYLADRYGRTILTIAAMTVSGACALFIGLAFGAHPLILGSLCLIWGISVIADSAQFSASVTELSPPDLIGTMLTIQTCIGFLVTLATIHLTPFIASRIGWQFAFVPLAVGPVAGVWAMASLRRHPEAVKLARGKR